MKQFLFLLIFLLPTFSVLADEYSDALDAEATGLSVDSKTDSKNASDIKAQNDWSFTAQSIYEELPGNLSRKRFEKALKKQYYGSYVFYSKLKKAQKESIYDAYDEGLEVEKLRSLITKNYKSNFRRN